MTEAEIKALASDAATLTVSRVAKRLGAQNRQVEELIATETVAPIIADALRKAAGQVKKESDLQEAERVNQCWAEDTLKLTPFDLPTAHNTVEYLYEWRKRWDRMEAQLAVARETLGRIRVCPGCGHCRDTASNAIAEIDKLETP